MTSSEGLRVKPEDQLVLELFVRDLAASLDFYTQLGFEIERADDSFAVLRFQGCALLLDQRHDLAGIPVPGRPQANVRLMVRDVDASWELAKRLGASVLVSIADRSYGLRDFTLLDPDGFGVRFASTLRSTE